MDREETGVSAVFGLDSFGRVTVAALAIVLGTIPSVRRYRV